MQLMLADM